LVCIDANFTVIRLYTMLYWTIFDLYLCGQLQKQGSPALVLSSLDERHLQSDTYVPALEVIAL